MSEAGPPRGGGASRGGAVDWDLLADHLGGALDTPEQERVARLLATDPQWAAAAAKLSRALDAVAADLSLVPAPAMPDDVAGRLDAALRGAAGSHTRPAGAAAHGPVRQRGPAGRAGADQRAAADGHTRPAARSRRRRLATRWATGLAAAAAVVAVASVGIGNLGLPGGGDDGGAGLAADEAGDAQAPQPALLASGTDYRRSSLPAVAPTAAELWADPEAERGAAPNLAGEPDAAPGAPRPDPAAGLDPALRGIWSHPGPCLAAIDDLYAPDPVAVESVDFAAFEGAPALVAWIDTAGGREVVVAGPDCGSPGAGADVRHRTPVG